MSGLPFSKDCISGFSYSVMSWSSSEQMGHDWPPRLSSYPGCAVIGKLKPLSVTGSCLPVNQWHLNSLAFESKPVPHGCVCAGAASVLKGGKEEPNSNFKNDVVFRDLKRLPCGPMATCLHKSDRSVEPKLWNVMKLPRKALANRNQVSIAPTRRLGIRVIKLPMNIGSGPHQVIKFPVWPWSSFCLFFPPIWY